MDNHSISFRSTGFHPTVFLALLCTFLSALHSEAQTLDQWRAQNFGTTVDSGDAATVADMDNDHLVNLLEYALLLDPKTPSIAFATAAMEGSNLCLTYQRRKAALAEVAFQCQWAPDPLGPWSSTGVTQSILSDDGTKEICKAVVSSNGAAKRFFKIQVSLTASSVPTSPSNLVATSTSSTELDLIWTDDATNESGFKLERRISGGSFSLLTTLGANVTGFHDIGLNPGATYIYRLLATNAAGDSGYTAEARITMPVSAPVAPTNPAAVAVSTTRINVTWTDSSTDETGFVIERRQSGTPTYILLAEPAANVTSYQDTGLPTGTKFYYQVAAKNATGTSSFSMIVNATTLSLPTAPANLVATAVSSSQINLAWTDTSSNESGFKIERHQSGAPTFTLLTTVGAGVTSYQDTGLPAGTGFYYRISSTNVVGDSQPTPSSIADTFPLPPAAPSSLIATAVSSSQINLAWTDNSNNETAFRIERRQNGTPTFSPLAEVGAGLTTFQNTGLSAATRYDYRVYAVNTGGNSAFSTVVSADTPPLPPGLNGPGMGNLNYAANEYMQVISRFDTTNGTPELNAQHSYGLNVVTMHKGYLSMVTAPDGGAGPGGLLFYDVSNPRSPQLVNRLYEPTGRTSEFREAHSMGFCSDLGGDIVVLQTRTGIEFWDWTDVRNPQQLSKMLLQNVNYGDYFNVVWQLCWQAPYVYIGASEQGIFIVDASDPRNPRLVDRGGQPNPIPTSQLGGFRVGPIFAVGNQLVITNMEGADGFSVLDISKPAYPQLLSTSGPVSFVYSTTFNGNRVIASARHTTNHMTVHDVSNPANILLMNNSVAIDEMLYCTTQDQFIIQGCQSNIVKVDTSNWSVVGQGTLNVPTPDHGQVTAIGNLIFVGNDHGTGSGLICHQMSPDIRPPEVNMISPKNGTTNQARTSRVGITLTDNIDLRTVNNGTFIIRPVGGSAISGKYSAQNSIVNFWPNQPLSPNTTYQVVIPVGGMKDWMGNAVSNAFNSSFTTGP